MIDASLSRPIRVRLDDYDYMRDVNNRIHLHRLARSDSNTPLNLLEEIVHGPPKVDLTKLSSLFKLSTGNLLEVIADLAPLKLFQLAENTRLVLDKQQRRYFQTQMLRFEPCFEPGLDFIWMLLKSVPIHLLPDWYLIPKTTNDIFDSLIEKIFKTPRHFQRYLSHLDLKDSTLCAIISDLFAAPTYSLDLDDLIQKYSLADKQIQTYLLYLEFYFIGTVRYDAIQSSHPPYRRVLTPFQEWSDYLRRRDGKGLSSSPPDQDKIAPCLLCPTYFIDDLTILLLMCQEQRPLTLTCDVPGSWQLPPQTPTDLFSFQGKVPHQSPTTSEPKQRAAYVTALIQKTLDLELTVIKANMLDLTILGQLLITQDPEQRAHTFYRSMVKQTCLKSTDPLYSESTIYEIEKSLAQLLAVDWAPLKLFMTNLMVTVGENSRMDLVRKGRRWHYLPPQYNSQEQKLIETVLLEWLPLSGLVERGQDHRESYFRLTPFGRSLFGADHTSSSP